MQCSYEPFNSTKTSGVSGSVNAPIGRHNSSRVLLENPTQGDRVTHLPVPKVIASVIGRTDPPNPHCRRPARAWLHSRAGGYSQVTGMITGHGV